MPWFVFAYGLFLIPFLVSRYVLRDRVTFRPVVFAILVMVFLWAVIGMFFWKDLDDWFREMEWRGGRVFVSTILAFLCALPAVFLAQRILRRMQPQSSISFRLILCLVVGVVVFVAMVAWIDEEFSYYESLEFAMWGVPIYLSATALIGTVRRRNVVERGVAVRLLIPFYLSATVILGFLAKGFYLEEQYWVDRDQLWVPTAEFPTKIWEAVLPIYEAEWAGFLEKLPPVRTETRKSQ